MHLISINGQNNVTMFGVYLHPFLIDREIVSACAKHCQKAAHQQGQVQQGAGDKEARRSDIQRNENILR